MPLWRRVARFFRSWKKYQVFYEQLGSKSIKLQGSTCRFEFHWEYKERRTHMLDAHDVIPRNEMHFYAEITAFG